MKGLNVYGKFLRKLRVDNNENMKDMAEKLNVSVSYLSAVELGKREIPAIWNEIIIKQYNLDKINSADLQKAFESSINELRINLNELESFERNIVASFARKVNLFNLEDFKEFEAILNKKGDD